MVFGLKLLGGFELRGPAGEPLRLPTRKAEALLAYLALEPRAHRRESLAALLWPEAGESAALASLRQTLSLIGKACGGPAMIGEGRDVALDRSRFAIDVLLLEAAGPGADAESLSLATAAYRGELLAGLLPAAPAFEDWLGACRSRLRERAAQAWLRLAQLQQAAGDAEAALQSALTLLQIDPLHEPAHCLVMSLHAERGRRAAALRQYQVCVEALQRELGAEPATATREHYNALLRQSPAGVLPSGEAPAVAAPLHATPLIGRERELALLGTVPADARGGQGRFVALLGEAGIGKTRLTEELTSRALAEGLQVWTGRCMESQQLIPFAPWVELLRHSRLAADEALRQALGAAVWADLTALLPELESHRGPATDESTALARQARLFEAVAQALALVARRTPTLLVIEDLHWCDDMSLRLLATVARRSRELPLPIVVTARDEALQTQPGLKRMLREALASSDAAAATLRIDVQPLTRAHTDALVQRLSRAGTDAQASARLAERVWSASEGNPFVVVEAVRAADSRLADAGESLFVPERVRELIQSHVEAASTRARRLLALVAVGGRELGFPLLREASGLGEQAASEALEELVRRRLLRLVGEAFDCTHARVRQAVLESLLPPTRASLHRALAEALEAQYGDEAEVADRLAYHYAHTDRHEKAVAYLTLLSQRASRSGAHEAALAALGEAEAHLQRLRAPLREALGTDLALRRSRSLLFLGRFDQVLELLAPLQAMVDRAGDPRVAAAYYVRRGATHTYLGHHAQAVADAERALEEAGTCDDTVTMGRAHFLLSLESFWARPTQGVHHGERAVSLLSATPERWWTGQAWWILGLNLSYRGRLVDALAAEAHAAELAEATGDRRLASYAAWTSGFIHTLAGHLDEAVPSCRRSLELALDPLNRMTSLGILALALVESGEWAEALELLEDAIAQALLFGIPQMHGLFLAFRAEAQLLRGDLAAARRSAQEGAPIALDAGYPYGRGWAQRVLARIEWAAGDRGAAETAMKAAIATFEGMGAPFEVGRSHVEWSARLKEAGRVDEAQAWARSGLAALHGLQAARHEQRARRWQHQLEAAAPG